MRHIILAGLLLGSGCDDIFSPIDGGDTEGPPDFADGLPQADEIGHLCNTVGYPGWTVSDSGAYYQVADVLPWVYPPGGADSIDWGPYGAYGWQTWGSLDAEGPAAIEGARRVSLGYVPWTSRDEQGGQLISWVLVDGPGTFEREAPSAGHSTVVPWTPVARYRDTEWAVVVAPWSISSGWNADGERWRLNPDVGTRVLGTTGFAFTAAKASNHVQQLPETWDSSMHSVVSSGGGYAWHPYGGWCIAIPSGADESG